MKNAKIDFVIFLQLYTTSLFFLQVIAPIEQFWEAPFLTLEKIAVYLNHENYLAVDKAISLFRDFFSRKFRCGKHTETCYVDVFPPDTLSSKMENIASWITAPWEKCLRNVATHGELLVIHYMTKEFIRKKIYAPVILVVCRLTKI